MNEQIRFPQIRLIGSDGKQIGIVAPQEGLKKAREENLDLVEISPTAKPPVCRIVDFGKYLYLVEKQEKKAKKKQHVIEIKEIKMTPKIEEHDYQTKLRSALTFFERGDKVKLTLVFRGREFTHPELGERVLHRFRDDVADIAEIEKNEGIDRKMMVLLFTPKKLSKKLEPGKPSAAVKPTENQINAKDENEQSGSEAV